MTHPSRPNAPNSPTQPPEPYREMHDPQWEEKIAALRWQRNDEFGGLVLTGACPSCNHPGAINVFVTTVGTALFTRKRPGKPPREFVACQCQIKHPGGPDKAGAGCGRWGYVPVVPPEKGASGARSGGHGA